MLILGLDDRLLKDICQPHRLCWYLFCVLGFGLSVDAVALLDQLVRLHYVATAHSQLAKPSNLRVASLEDLSLLRCRFFRLRLGDISWRTGICLKISERSNPPAPHF